MKKRLLPIVIVIVLLLSSCTQEVTEIGESGGVGINYVEGLITFVDYDPLHEVNDEIYTDEYRSDYSMFLPYYSLCGDKYVMFGNNETVYYTDSSSDAVNFCDDPLCDHSKPGTCMESIGDFRNVIITDEGYTYFLSMFTIYRYSQDEMICEIYAKFDLPVTRQFIMGKYLYAELSDYSLLRINLADDTAVVLPDKGLLGDGNTPYRGYIYSLESVTKNWVVSTNIVRYNADFSEKEILVENLRYDCFNPFMLYDDKLYYQSEEKLYICSPDDTSDPEIIHNVKCFGINDEYLFIQRPEQLPGAWGMEYGERYQSTIETGNKIYYAPVNKTDSFELLVQMPDTEGVQLTCYTLESTERYVYMFVDEYTDYNLVTILYRYDLKTRKLIRTSSYM